MGKHSNFNRQRMQSSGMGSRPRIRRIPGTRIRRIVSLSPQAQARLQCIEFAQRHTVALAADAFGVHRSTIYRWMKRYDPNDLRTLEPRSRRPHRTRWTQWTAEEEALVLRLRRENPGFGKHRVHLLALREGMTISPSTIGRMLRSLMRRNLLPVSRRVRQVRRRQARPHAIRRPQDALPPTEPGDLIQLDTMHLRSKANQVCYQFTAIDVVSRTAVVGIARRSTARTARNFLQTLLADMPFPVREIQVDGGSEFMGEFETACQDMGIVLYVLPPRSPKLNGMVERLNGTSRREFWDYYRGTWDTPTLAQDLRTWMISYNHKRPHMSLGFLSPAQWLATTRVAYVSN